MRNPDRLDNFYDEMKELHKKHFPDWRFGQLMSNFFGWVYKTYKMDIFFPEDDKMLIWFYEFCGEKRNEHDR